MCETAETSMPLTPCPSPCRHAHPATHLGSWKPSGPTGWARQLLSEGGGVVGWGSINWLPGCRPWLARFQSRVMQLKYSTQPHERCGRLGQPAGKLEQKEGTVQGS